MKFRNGLFVLALALAVAVAFAFAGCGEVKGASVDAALGPDADTTPPMITLTEKPMALDTPTATFSFSADEPATFKCRVDNNTLADCASPTTFTSLAPGDHKFEVFGTDRAGNQGSASYMWQVEPPCVASSLEAEAVPNHPNWGVASGSVLHGGSGLESSGSGSGTTFTFKFTAKGLTAFTENGPNRNDISITIDSLAPVIVHTNAAGFTYQNPNVIATGLPNVEHTVQVMCVSPYCSVDYFNFTCP